MPRHCDTVAAKKGKVPALMELTYIWVGEVEHKQANFM